MKSTVQSLTIRSAVATGILVMLLGLSGCAQFGALMRADQIEKQSKADRARFLDKVSDAYFLIGYEYFSLAKLAEEENQAEKAGDMATKAGLYNLLSRELKRQAEDLRISLEAQPPEWGEPRSSSLFSRTVIGRFTRSHMRRRTMNRAWASSCSSPSNGGRSGDRDL